MAVAAALAAALTAAAALLCVGETAYLPSEARG